MYVDSEKNRSPTFRKTFRQKQKSLWPRPRTHLHTTTVGLSIDVLVVRRVVLAREELFENLKHFNIKKCTKCHKMVQSGSRCSKDMFGNNTTLRQETTVYRKLLRTKQWGDNKKTN